MPEETPPAAPARLASARPFSSARRVSLGEAHCATTALRPWGEAAGHGQVPPASAAVGAAVGDGGAGSPDGPVLLHLALLREQLEALAKKMEHNQCSLLGAIGVVERQCRPGGAGAPQRAELGAAAAPGSQGALEAGAPGSAPGASSGEPEPQAPPRAPGGAGSPAGDDEESVPDTPVSPHADAAEQRAAPASSKAHDSERSGRRKGTESSLDVPYFFFSMNKRGSSLRETEVHELSAVTAQMSSHQATIKKHRLTLDHRNKEIRAWAEKLVATSQFETIVAGSIVFNAVAIGWNSDWSMRNIGSDRPIFFIALDWIFLSVFMLELLLRMVAEGGQFFHYRAKMFGWNMFDSGIIALTLLNNAEVLGVRLSVVRVFRVMRLVSVIRVVRLMNGFMELRMMVDGIMNCGKTLLWSFLLLIVLTFIYAVVCLEFIAEWLTQAEQDMGGASTAGLAPADQELMASTMTFVKDNYRSLYYSIYTLFKAVSGGVSWGEVADPLSEVNIILVLTFPFFIGVTVFCVLNIVTAAFVEAAARKSKDEEANALEHIAERKKWIKVISDIFDRHDSDSRGCLDYADFATIMTDWRTQTAFTDMGIDVSFQQAKVLFKLFDWDGDGRIDINEFAQGVHHLKGPARSLDVFRHFMKLSKKIEKLEKLLQVITGPTDRPLFQSRSRGYSMASSENSGSFRGAA